MADILQELEIWIASIVNVQQKIKDQQAANQKKNEAFASRQQHILDSVVKIDKQQRKLVNTLTVMSKGFDDMNKAAADLESNQMKMQELMQGVFSSQNAIIETYSALKEGLKTENQTIISELKDADTHASNFLKHHLELDDVLKDINTLLSVEKQQMSKALAELKHCVLNELPEKLKKEVESRMIVESTSTEQKK